MINHKEFSRGQGALGLRPGPAQGSQQAYLADEGALSCVSLMGSLGLSNFSVLSTWDHQCLSVMDEGSILVQVTCFFFLLLLNVATNNQIKGRRMQRKWVMNKQKGQDSSIQCGSLGTIDYPMIGRFNSTFCSFLPATMQLFQVSQWNDSVEFYRINQHVNVGRLQTQIQTSGAALRTDKMKHLFIYF